MTEITPDALRAHCGSIVERGAPAKVANPADEVGPASIATFVPKDRSLSPSEIRVMLKQLEHIATLPTIRLGCGFTCYDGAQERTAGRGLG